MQYLMKKKMTNVKIILKNNANFGTHILNFILFFPLSSLIFGGVFSPGTH